MSYLRGMCIGSDMTSFKELRMTLWNQRNPLEKLIWSLAYRVPSSLIRGVKKVTSQHMQEPQDIWGTSKIGIHRNL